MRIRKRYLFPLLVPLLLVLGLAVLRIIWGFMAESDVNDLLADLRTKGQPATLAEALHVVPPERNAAVLWRETLTSNSLRFGREFFLGTIFWPNGR